jgi:hypothetical protein
MIKVTIREDLGGLHTRQEVRGKHQGVRGKKVRGRGEGGKNARGEGARGEEARKKPKSKEEGSMGWRRAKIDSSQ